MKKTEKSILALVLCLMVFFSFAASAQAAMGDTTLKVGSSGPDVVELQNKLNYVGYDVGKADGIFGNMTKQGVIAFQSSSGLVADGIVGPLTAGALNKLYNDKLRQEKANALIASAKQLIGVHYQWGGTSPETGFDCSGFTQYVFAQNGITIPRISRDQYAIGTPILFENLQPGDLVFFSFAKNGIVDHVGIYIGSGQFINSASSKGVTIYSIGDYWKSIYVGAKRVF